MNATNYLRIATLIVAALSLTSCSLLVDFAECSSDDDCDRGGRCVDEVCEAPEEVVVTDFIVEDTTWTAGNTYVLDGIIFVVAPATLTIEPGVIVKGRRGGGLVSLAGAKLEAEGTRQEPIIFTSDRPVGQRLAGDWAGLAIVGRARTNRENFNLRIDTDEDTSVGGSDDSWDCGTLRYVRIEFGGSEVNGQKALKGLTVAGCGTGTTIEYVQTHLSDDDGVGIFGGTVDLRYIVSTRARDDAFDFDTGWRGTAQFLAVQQDNLGIEALEIENLAEDPTAMPFTDGRIYNFTLLGGDREGDRQVGIYGKLGGRAILSHGVVMGQKTAGVVIEDEITAMNADMGEFLIQNTLFNAIGQESEDVWFEEGDTIGDGYEYENYAVFEEASLNNVFGADPGFDSPYDLENPSWAPSPDNITGVDPPPAPFDETAVYRGAFSPSAVPWTEGWTSYPLR